MTGKDKIIRTCKIITTQHIDLKHEQKTLYRKEHDEEWQHVVGLSRGDFI